MNLHIEDFERREYGALEERLSRGEAGFYI
jgi:hypothetical protein